MTRIGIIAVGTLALAGSFACSSEVTSRGGESGGAGGEESGGSSGKGGTGGSKSGGSGGSSSGGTAGSKSGGSGGTTSGGSGGTASGGSAGSAGAGGSAGGAEQGGAPGTAEACTPIPRGIIRDFNDAHPDFGIVTDASPPALPADLVKPDLDADEKPVYGLTGPVTDGANVPLYHGATEFAQWWRPRGIANSSKELTLSVSDLGNGTTRLGDPNFWFPIDGMLLGNVDGTKAPYNAVDYPGNELWTWEMTFDIEYQGLDTETLILVTDDDSFLFINKKLAINNGLLHGSLGSSIRLKAQAEALGLEVGRTYPVHVFQAERNIAGIVSLFARNIKFVNCGARLPKISD